ncbi:LytTR family transcriptional regulator DNA-binding domain-containing protein [Aureibaculum sp. A20]|uniref:LytTR family transcriptional regulator DNA-binding domain-containing protein n=1 Tax=Aureibaculum flavum TaxID=2795986 RepID=A0ABS0WV73_9FLAO|nr:LytTR family transcriptional regulator DNA-binding domain-containing protein [Aureibaculum flavum]MBJ2175886.1 LytTR family transcriptional regulator DNA-binding domain-containing protein [Aureibaculum flavum]
MKFISIYIVEDEPLIAATIETALLKQGYNVVGDAEDVITALKDIAQLQPDLILVDIQLDGDKDGVDLAIELDKQQIPYLYLTSQTDFETIERVKATQPLGYIVKPFTEHSLRSNIELAWHNYEEENAGFLILKSDGRTHKVNQNSILYLKAFDNYCYVYTTTRSYLVPHTLKYMSEQLNSSLFVQAHRSYWVNINHIEGIESNKLFLKTEPIPLSASQKKEVMRKLKRS